MKIRVTDIEWDCPTKKTLAKLPKSMDFDLDEEIRELVSEALTDETGWCHLDWKMHVIIDV